MATFTVTTLQDVSDSNDAETSLREAIFLANQQAGADTIVFETGVAGVIRLTEGELLVSDSLAIDGAGRITITGDRNGDDAIVDGDVTDVAASLVGANRLVDNTRLLNFGLTDGEFSLTGLTLTGGRVSDD